MPLTALWAHGSLALGDYQPGRSDLDLIALIETTPAPAQQDELRRVHQALHDQVPLARQLHCTYVARAEWDGPGRDHLTWAHGEMFARPVTPVSRRELHLGGLVLLGPRRPPWFPRSPTRSSPTSSARTCATSVPAYRTSRRRSATLGGRGPADLRPRHGNAAGRPAHHQAGSARRPPGLGAPDGLVRDIYQRRYGTRRRSRTPGAPERGSRRRTCLRDGITRLLALAGDADR